MLKNNKSIEAKGLFLWLFNLYSEEAAAEKQAIA